MHTFMSETIPKFPRQRNAYDHIQCFKQVLRVYEPLVEAIQVASFKLTLDDQVRLFVPNHP